MASGGSDANDAPRKRAAKKAAPRKATTPTKRTRTSGTANSGSSKPQGPRRSSHSRSPSHAPNENGRMRPGQIASAASEQLAELVRAEPERTIQLESDGEEWRITVEVLEVRRVPDTTDVLGVYEVTMSDSGELRGYRLTGRRERGRVEDRS